jgi:hypothetical protein
MVDSQVLKKLTFPAYCVRVLDNGLVVISGGGGTAKTGVENWLEIGKIRYDAQFNATFITIHNFATSDAVMKFTSFKYNANQNADADMKTNQPDELYIVAAVGCTIEIYKLMPIIEKTLEDTLSPSNSISDLSSLLNNSATQKSKKRIQNSSSGKKQAPNKNGFNLKASTCLKLVKKLNIKDDHDKQPSNNIDINVLTVLLPNKTNKLKEIILFAGLTNGSIVIWNLFNNYEKLYEIKKAHAKEIDDLQINENDLLSIGKDGKAYLWSITVKKSFEKIMELRYDFLCKKNMRMRHARFSQINPILYTTYIPNVRDKYPKSYIVKWNSTSYKVEAKHEVRNTVITAFQCNKNGTFICYGDYLGQIELLNDRFEYLIKFKKHHSGVVTDLAFYHDSIKSYDYNKMILSLSIDRTLKCYKYINVKRFDYLKMFFFFSIILVLFLYIFTYLE